MDDAKHGEPSATKEDKNPRGGLSAKGRKKFGVKKGVTSYSSAGDEGKRRWVRWALRFTKTPQPLKKPDGSPTRYALMFRAWGEPVPTTAAAVRAVHAKALARRKTLKMGADAAIELELVGCDDCPREFLTDDALFTHLAAHLDAEPDEAALAEVMAEQVDGGRAFSMDQRKSAAKKGEAQKDGSYPIKNASDLRNAIQAYGRSSNKAATKAHIIKRAKALGLTRLLPEGWDSAMLHECKDAACERAFINQDLLTEHAAAVHTFDDTRQLVATALREKYGVGIGMASKLPYEQRTYIYLRDLAQDWVVFDMEPGGSEAKMMKVGYAVDDKGEVAFVGEPVEVLKKTVYEAKAVEPASA